MKKSILKITAAVFIAGAFFTGCTSQDKKVENAEQKVQEAKDNLEQARIDSVSDFHKFKNEANEAIAYNERRIADIKTEIKNEKKEAREKYEKQMDALEKKNNELKAKLEEVKDDGKSDWQIFKTEFNHDLEGIGNAFKDITVKNTK